MLLLYYQCRIDQDLRLEHFQGIGTMQWHPIWEQIMRWGELTFGDGINYMTRKHLNESSKHSGGSGEGPANTWQAGLLFVFQAYELTENCQHLTGKPEKHAEEQKFCCCIVFPSSLLIVIQDSFGKTTPKCIFKLDSLFT